MKPYVICHMMPSVDGRLRTDRWDVPEIGHDEYERTADSYRADAWICGRKTMEEFAGGRSVRSHRREKIPRDDYVVARKRRGARYAIALDPEGKLHWNDNEIDGDPIIEVLGEDVSNSFLAFLREKGISYVFAGRKGAELNLSRVLEKLASRFGIRKLMLEGGGETNGAFLHQGLVDELSLLLTPVADGGIGEPTLFDVEHGRSRKAAAKLRLKSVRRAASDMLWIKYAVRKHGISTSSSKLRP
ncbi:MAG: RibD family protein [Myxococcales bacterium]|nr:RibD family protein [Myxococcales bacterium]